MSDSQYQQKDIEKMLTHTKKQRYDIGEIVYIKMKGSGQLWYPGTVAGYDLEKYLVFCDNLEYSVEPEFVQPEARFKRSTTRRRSTSRSRTRRSTSRSRSRSRSRRQPPSKSPARETKTSKAAAEVTTDTTTMSPGRQTRQRKEPVKEEPEKQNHKTNHNHQETPTRHSARLQAKHEEEEGIHSLKPTLEEIGLPPTTGHIGKTKDLEFGGWLGTLSMTVFLPVAVFYLNFMCQKESCTIKKPAKCPSKLSTFFDLNAALIFFGWIAFQMLLAILPIGSVVDGVVLKHGHRLPYRCNGFISLLISCAVFGVLVYTKKPVVYVYDHYIAILTTAVIFSTVLSVILYIRARYARNSDLSPAGNSGYLIYDFFMGHELNPRIGNLDLKFFFEMRPGLIGWVMINFCFIAKDCIDNKFPSYPLLLVSAFHLIYVVDALWFEDSILTTMDITHEGFGFMLCFGDVAWVPFLYTYTTRFLLEHPQMLPNWALAAIAFLNLVGYIIFRGSNSQKNEFRKNPYNPALSHLESIPTAAGKRLLVSGWWGLCRHPNYMGDIIMAIAWSLPCGFKFVLPHFYAVYLALLLISRALRDDRCNRKKYAAAWDRYRERVPYIVIPKVF